MRFVIKITVTLTLCLFAVKTEKLALSNVAKSETTLFKRQYPESAPWRKPKRSSTAENENLLEMPENDIKKLLRIKALPSLNTAFTKENCHKTFLSPSNIKLYHKEVNAATILNKIFYKFQRSYILDPSLNETNVNNRSIVTLRDKTMNLIKNASNNTAISGNCNKQLVHVDSTSLISFQTTQVGTNEFLDISDKNAFPFEKPWKLEVSKRKSRKIRFSDISSSVSARRNSELDFPDVPTGDVMKVPDLKLEREYFLFGLFSTLMGYLQPSSFPIGFVKDAVQSHAPVHILFLKALEIEGPMLGWIFIWFLLALALPAAVAARLCCRKGNMQRLIDTSSNSSRESSHKWTKMSLGALMHLLLLLFLGCIALMLVTNEQVSKTSNMLPNVTDTIVRDVETFITNTHNQISAITTSSIRIVVDAAHRHLEGAEELLGKPLQSALDAETGLGTAMQALVGLTEAVTVLHSRVSNLLKDCREARKVGKDLQGNLTELSRLLTLARQECLPRDQALCDTLQTSGLNVSFRVDQLSSESNLQQLQAYGEKDEFNRTIEQARRTFQGLPRRVSLETAMPRAGLRSALNRHRNKLYDAVESLENLSRSITGTLSSARKSILKVLQSVAAKDVWRWIAVLAVCLLTFFIWGLLICGAPCGCDPTPKTIPFLLTGLGLTCVLSLILWAFGTVAFVLGGHGETLICQPLYDQPKYTVLSDLLNAGGIVYQDEGLFNHVLKGNVSLRVDVVLRDCENNEPTYKVFNLESAINLNSLTNYYEWEDFAALLQKFSFNLSTVQILTPSLEKQLEELSAASEINLKKYRYNISGLVTSRDLNSLSEQLESVAKQLSTLKDAQTMEELAYKTRKIVLKEVQPLKELRDKILYKMAAVEVLVIPINKQVDQSLYKLRTIQDFIEHSRSNIVDKVIKNYLAGLKSYFLQMSKYITGRVTYDIGKCRPLWDCFDAARTICKTTVDPVNGFSFACFLCILLFLGLAPVIIRTVAQYKETAEDSFSSITHRRARNGLLIDDEGTWATPSPPSSSEEGQRLSHPSVWTTPRQPLEPLIPSPPRPPQPLPTEVLPISTRLPEPPVLMSKASRILDPARLIQLASRIHEPTKTTKSPIPRFLQPGTSKAARDRHEALKLIERIDRRTPRSWL